ncbi:TetR/AcrR family transcriptional regulator [Nonomuraea purpurea]|uniref:TetR/AcrR family transcriptional regulator n=1 Tax=Nonomuraea purpurea TaxID=1849276 RepID=A0ABV8G0V5_9ACTN
MPSKDQQLVQKGRTFTETARRTQIVRCAIETIADIGYGKASFEEIARRANISRSLISYHFTGRDELVAEVLTSVYSRAAEYMTAIIAEADTPPAQLEAFIRGNLAFIGENRQDMAAVLGIVLHARTQSLTAKPESSAAQPRLRGLASILEWGQQSGDFRPFSSSAMALAILQAIDGAHQLTSSAEDVDLDVYADELVTIFSKATRQEDV